jgi:transposase-like protein
MSNNKTKKYCNVARQYSKDDLQEAINAVYDGRMSVSDAARHYNNIPRSTLDAHVSGKTNSLNRGRPTVLNTAEEQTLVDSLIYLADGGFGLDNYGLKIFVADFCINIGKPDLFQGSQPSLDWIYAFKSRWSHQLTKRRPRNISPLRAKAGDKEIVDHFFDLLNATLTELNLHDKPNRIFNCDETGYSCDPSKRRIFCRRGEHPYSISSDNEKQHYTVNVSNLTLI